MKLACLRSTMLFATCVLSLSACVKPPHVNSARLSENPNPIQAAWVVLGEQGQAVARVITTAASCPLLRQDEMDAPMQVRALAGTEAPRATAMAIDSKASAFPVLTCESALKPGVRNVSVAGKKMPVPESAPLKIVVIGDTGCRLKGAGHTQACDDVNQWSFAIVAKTAADFAPDLVIHVGDYHYREAPCPAGNQGCAGSPWGYGWDTWQADFFAPAAPLLAAAPWVMVRGNHESCFRAGQGWWRFMDPRALQPGRDCNLAENDALGDYSAPYAVPLDGGAQLIVFDSSKAPNQALAKPDPVHRIYSDQVKAADQLARKATTSVFLSHHPVLGFALEKDKIFPGNAALQSVLKELYPRRLFAPGVQMLLAGHVHVFEAITFASNQPAQFVIGNSGTAPDTNFPKPLPPRSTPYVHAKVAHFNSTNRIGFTTMERVSVTATDWTVKSWDKDGALLTTCHVGRMKKECS